MPTPFQESVYYLCSKIPKGNISTYKELSRKLKSSPRGVGQALKRNPYAPKVPCHRVVTSTGNLGGYNGILNSRKKITLLKKEGINIKKGKIENFSKILFKF
jgi:methylated-DNA-[protein]-cysteine S-methyltransferase